MAQQPFLPGARVSVVRTRHGWHDGRLKATVTQRYQRDSGTWGYLVRDDEGHEHEVQHTRDMRPETG